MNESLPLRTITLFPPAVDISRKASITVFTQRGSREYKSNLTGILPVYIWSHSGSTQTELLDSENLVEEPAFRESPDEVPLTETNLEQQISSARDDRLRLIAMRYENSASIEDSARYHLLTARMRRLVPSVTPTERATMESILSDLEGVAAFTARLTST